MGQGQNLLCNKWARHPIFPVRFDFETAHPKTYFCPHTHGRSAQGAPPSICLCMNKPTVEQWEYKKSARVCPATTSRICERTFTLYVNVLFMWTYLYFFFQYITSFQHICWTLSSNCFTGFQTWHASKKIVSVISNKFPFKDMRLMFRFLQSFWNLAGI